MSDDIEINEQNIESILFELFKEDDINFKLAHYVYDAQNEFRLKLICFKGFLALADSFKCFFIETFNSFSEIANEQLKTNLHQDHALFLSKIVTNFRTICASESTAANGYPYEGYSLLRNVFESTVLISAALQNYVSFEDISGFKYDGTKNSKNMTEIKNNIKKNKIIIERKINDLMFGKHSGLPQDIQDELRSWDDLFDMELHGSRLSLSQHLDWFKGKKPLELIPEFNKKSYAMFLNRYVEISWLLTRTLSCLQTDEIQFSAEWKRKYDILNRCFELHSKALTDELGKPIGNVMAHFAKSKYPFHKDSVFSFAQDES